MNVHQTGSFIPSLPSNQLFLLAVESFGYAVDEIESTDMVKIPVSSRPEETPLGLDGIA